MIRWKHRINRMKLRKAIGQGDKMPANFANLFTVRGVNEANDTLNVTVIVSQKSCNSRKSSAHRIFVDCPNCDSTVPAGRLHQHIGSKVCNDTVHANAMKWII